MTRNLLTADQTAKRLGVKVDTVYAYVSRGILTRTVAEDGRTSRFDPREVDELFRRGRPRQDRGRQGAVQVSLATDITRLADGELSYRGHPVAALVGSATFETVAELLWTGRLPAHSDAGAWTVPTAAARLGAAVSAALPRQSPVIERLTAVTAALAGGDPLRVDRRPEAVARVGRTLIGTYVHVLGPAPRGTGRRAGDPTGNRATGAHRRTAAALWPKLSPLPATRPRVRVLDAALVLLADHELAASTLAARVAASTRADPYATVGAALGAVAGPLHGTTATAVHRMLLDAARSADPAGATAVAATAGRLPGFGHVVHQHGDPRAGILLDRLATICPRPVRRVVDTVFRTAQDLGAGAPNMDAAMAAMALAADMPVGATDALFPVARTAGWLAHTLEEYGETALRFRARAVYTGP